MPYPIYDTYEDEGMIVTNYDEEWVFEKMSCDMDPSSQEPCVEDEKWEVDFGDDNTHDPHNLIGQWTISKHCMETSSQLIVVYGDNILIDENK